MRFKKYPVAALLLLIIVSMVVSALIIKNKYKPEQKKTEFYRSIDLSQCENGKDIFITPKVLFEKLKDKNLVIIDASHPKVYRKEHIPGAVNIGFKGLSNCAGKPGDKKWGTILDKEELTRKLESLGINNDSFVVAYSDILKGPGAGGRAVWQMKMAGLKNVKLLYGGLEVWKKAGYDLSKTIVKPIPAVGLVLQDYDERYRVEQTYLYENIDKLKIVDVRSLKEFTGEDTHRGEARGGHIKGAIWLEWLEFMNKDCTLKSSDEIHRLMAEKGIKPEDDFVLY